MNHKQLAELPPIEDGYANLCATDTLDINNNELFVRMIKPLQAYSASIGIKIDEPVSSTFYQRISACIDLLDKVENANILFRRSPIGNCKATIIPLLFAFITDELKDLVAQVARPQAIGLATVPFCEEDGIGTYGKYAIPKSSAPPEVKAQVYTERTARFSPGSTSLKPRRREHVRSLNVEGASQYHHPWNEAVRANAGHYDLEWTTNMFVPVDRNLCPTNDLKNALILFSVVAEAVLFVLLDSGCGDGSAKKSMSAALPFWDDGPAYIGTDSRNPICGGFILWDWTKAGRPYTACHFCGREFDHPSNLKNHRLVHQDQRPYHCSHEGCPVAFKVKGALKQHAVAHSRSREFACDQPGCSQKFVTNGELMRHVS
ncbi:hypothetical protein I350_03689 [Cryptococcus amylolentus CBS 6273]|uniref:C2H2-type domain-containing protein n=1 Tax=Cryptococcus amylolentus CBS 6273 TaxID=1296118 RepID=A0A1E3K513_9TREE|nr:hypothetical protein I350_03689 [Cryptococcus amylolentus CBS 6273]